MIENISSKGNWNWYCETRFPSDAERCRQLLDVILQQLEYNNWSQHYIFGIHLALEEALVNAIKHGNKYSLEKQVFVRCGVSSSQFIIDIEDEGDGFDPSSLPDPREDAWIDIPNGRGVLLMRNFMDRVEYNAKGNEVLLEKGNVLTEAADDNPESEEAPQSESVPDMELQADAVDEFQSESPAVESSQAEPIPVVEPQDNPFVVETPSESLSVATAPCEKTQVEEVRQNSELEKSFPETFPE